MLSTKTGRQSWVEVTREVAAADGWRFHVRSGSLSKASEERAKAGTRAGKAKDFTDPPYYDNISYAELSDFFYVWLRRSLSPIYPSLFATLLTPKNQELIASAYRHEGSSEKAQSFFEKGLGHAFVQMRSVQQPDLPLTVYYAFKQSETDDNGDGDDVGSAATASTGWETMLAGLIHAGFSVHGTWPIRTELSNRMVGIGRNALASSIVLSCRPRVSGAPLATRREFIAALKRELPDALAHLQRGSIAPVDLAQASIGPGMAVFTRYTKVMEADGSPMQVRQALALINQTLDEVLAEQEGEFDADTRWALAWFEQHSMDEGAFGVADVLARAKNTAVNALVEAGIVRARGGKVRLVKRVELPADWNPATDSRLRHWEIVQHLIRALETGGETAAADLLRRVGGMSEVARDLAYRLYNICERKGWASEALAYNGLVIAWPEISKLAQQTPVSTGVGGQTDMFQ
jgi:putative DNA methylase